MPPEGLILMDVEYSGVKFEYNGYAKNKFIKTLKKGYLQKKTLSAVQMEIMENLLDD